MVQMEYETMERKREMDSELYGRSAEVKELKRQMETLGCLSPTVQSRQNERVRMEKYSEMWMKTNKMNQFVNK